MNKVVLALLTTALVVPTAFPATPAEVVAPIYKFVEAFNAGDTKTAFALYASGNITVVDEYAPYLWVGPHAGQDWAASYDKHAAATGVTDGKVTYGKTTRTVIEGDLAYVVVPTVYLYKEHGKALQEEGQITAVMHAEGGAWKIRTWTWTGVNPHPAK